MVVPVVVEIDDPVELGLHGDVEVLGVFDTLAHGLASVLLHLNVVKFPGKKDEKGRR